MTPAEYNGLNDEEKAIADSGTEIVPVSPELYAEIKAAAQPVYDSIAEKVGQDLVDAYLGK